MPKKILIYGGSSLISKELISIYSREDYNFIIFCRKKESVLSDLSNLKLDNNKFGIFETDLIDLQKNLELISKLDDNIDGVIWISGYTGDPAKEMNDVELASNNIKINFLNPVLIINKLLPKIINNGDGFLAVMCSVAGLRGRAKNIFYGSWEGLIIFNPSGKNGFGYDPLFYIENLDSTAAELNQADKNKLSHRASAMRKVTNYLKKNI